MSRPPQGRLAATTGLPPLGAYPSTAPSLLWRLVCTAILAGLASTILWAFEARADGGFIARAPVEDYTGLPAEAAAQAPVAVRSTRRARTAALDVDTTGSVDPGRRSFDDDESGARIVPRAKAPMGCVPGELKAVLARVASRFGPISVESTRRGHTHNRRAGGARKSLHLSCRAVDFRVKARSKGLYAFIRAQPEVGGFKIYRGGIIHIDNGERRHW